MIRWIVQLSLRLQFLIVVLAAVFAVFAIAQLRNMPINVFPEFDPPLVEVQTEALGLSAAEVESLITVPMEADLLNGVAWLQQIHSESVAGLSSILLVFEPGTNPIRARQMVQERLTQAHALPNVSKPPTMLQPLSATGRVMIVGLSSEELSMIELGVLARWNIKPRLIGVPGVANVAVWGQRERQLQVQVDPAELHEQGVTLSQIIETTGEALWVSPLSYLESSKPGTGGWIDTPNQRLGIRHLLPISSPEDLNQVAIVDREELLLGDVTTIVEDHQPLIGDATLNDSPALLLVIEKFPGANILEVTEGVEDALEAMAPGLGGVNVDTTVFRPANYIEQATSNLSMTVLIASLLALVVLFLLLWNWRTLLIAVLTIPLSLIVATYILYQRGEPFNTMVLAGLVMALGIVIDDAVGNLEHLQRRLHQHRVQGSDASTSSIILESSMEIRSPVIFATLILLLTILPLYLMEGLTGVYLQPLVVTYILAVLSSLVVALLVAPALSLLLFSNSSGVRSESPLVRGLQKLYNGPVAGVLRAPAVVFIAAAVIAIVGIALFPTLERSLMPSLKQPDLLIDWDGSPGTSRGAMNRITGQISQELRAIDGVRSVGSHVGRAETGDQVVGINSGELWVSIDPAADYDATVVAINQVTDGYPGLFRQVHTYQPERIGNALLSPADDLVVRVYGVDLDILDETAAEVAQALSGANDIVEARPDVRTVEPQVEIEVDLAAAETFGIKPGDVRRAATTLIAGIHVGSLFEDQKVFDVIVLGVPEIHNTLTSLQNMLLDTPNGEQVMLKEVADVRIAPAPVIIERDAVSRYVDVGLTLSGQNVSAVMSDIRSHLSGLDLPLEYRVEILNESIVRQAAQQRTWSLVIAVLIGIFLLMQAATGGWRLAAYPFISLLMVLAGGIIAVFFTGGILTLGAFFGFFTILGIAVRNSLVSFSYFQQLERREEEPFGPEVVQRGARERLGPILTTALTTAAALLPIVFFGNIAGHEVIRPMAIVILGGLVTSTLYNLFLVPTLYMRFRPESDPEVVQIGDEAIPEAA